MRTEKSSVRYKHLERALGRFAHTLVPCEQMLDISISTRCWGMTLCCACRVKLPIHFNGRDLFRSQSPRGSLACGTLMIYLVRKSPWLVYIPRALPEFPCCNLVG